MSKSLGNIMKVREIREKYSGEATRYFILSAHYRNPLDFCEEQLQQSRKSLQRLKNTIYNVKYILKQEKFKDSLNKNEELLIGQIKENEKKFMEAMDDDFNTPVALSWIFALNKEVNIYLTSEGFKNKKVLEDVVKFYHDLAGQVLGILGDEDLKINFEEQEIQNLIDEREKARKEKDWSMADKIRDKLKENGIILEDTSEGVRWKKTIF